MRIKTHAVSTRPFPSRRGGLGSRLACNRCARRAMSCGRPAEIIKAIFMTGIPGTCIAYSCASEDGIWSEVVF